MRGRKRSGKEMQEEEKRQERKRGKERDKGKEAKREIHVQYLTQWSKL